MAAVDESAAAKDTDAGDSAQEPTEIYDADDGGQHDAMGPFGGTGSGPDAGETSSSSISSETQLLRLETLSDKHARVRPAEMILASTCAGFAVRCPRSKALYATVWPGARQLASMWPCAHDGFELRTDARPYVFACASQGQQQHRVARFTSACAFGNNAAGDCQWQLNARLAVGGSVPHARTSATVRALQATRRRKASHHELTPAACGAGISSCARRVTPLWQPAP
jgi:hypothetical protein